MGVVGDAEARHWSLLGLLSAQYSNPCVISAFSSDVVTLYIRFIGCDAIFGWLSRMSTVSLVVEGV